MTTEASAFWYRKSGGQERTGESVWENGQSLASEPEIGEARGEDATDPRELAGKPQRAGDASCRAERVAGPRLRRRARERGALDSSRNHGERRGGQVGRGRECLLIN